MANDLIHPITEAQIAQYEEDGVICIRGQFGPEWIDRMRVAGVGQIDEPSVRHTNMDDEGDPGRFISGAHMSRHSDEFMDFAVNSPAAEIAARLMRLDKVRFFCTTYDPARDAYIFDYSLFVGLFIGASIMLITLGMIIRESRKRKSLQGGS